MIRVWYVSEKMAMLLNSLYGKEGISLLFHSCVVPRVWMNRKSTRNLPSVITIIRPITYRILSVADQVGKGKFTTSGNHNWKQQKVFYQIITEENSWKNHKAISKEFDNTTPALFKDSKALSSFSRRTLDFRWKTALKAGYHPSTILNTVCCYIWRSGNSLFTVQDSSWFF